MPTRLLINGSAAFLAAQGIMTLFLPKELATAIGLDPSAALPLQLVAGGLLGIAALNWFGRSAIYGGIYGRPMVMANLTFGIMTTTSLVSALMDGVLGPWWWGLAGAYGLYTFGFGRLMWTSPWAAGTTPQASPPGGGTD